MLLKLRAWNDSLVDDVEHELRYARILRLREPEDRLLLQLPVLLLLRDVHELVDGGSLTALREREDELLLHLAVTHRLVQGRQVGDRDGAHLTGPEQRLLAHL